jgi:hypothetical protein
LAASSKKPGETTATTTTTQKLQTHISNTAGFMHFFCPLKLKQSHHWKQKTLEIIALYLLLICAVMEKEKE